MGTEKTQKQHLDAIQKAMPPLVREIHAYLQATADQQPTEDDTPKEPEIRRDARGVFDALQKFSGKMQTTIMLETDDNA